jgi:undecaprenyl-diphosphatase
MPHWINAVILGIVEGITEFLPVSSTGHLLVTEHLLHASQTLLFNILIQCGAVIAVIPLFRARFDQFIFRWRETATQHYLLKLMLAFVLSGIGGLILDKKGYKLDDQNLRIIAVALLVGGIIFLAIEAWLKGKTLKNEVTWAMAVAVGLGQLVAIVFPGASRSGTTIMLCLLLGLTRPAATEFCFLVGIPTMLAAGGWKLFGTFRHRDVAGPQEDWGMILLATAVAAVVSFIAVKWLLRYVQNHTFNAFGWYRIGAAIIIFAFFASR